MKVVSVLARWKRLYSFRFHKTLPEPQCLPSKIWTSNQRWNNVVYTNVEIYNVQQRWNNVVSFNVELNNVRQRGNNVVIFKIDFRNVGQRRNNVVNLTIWKKNNPWLKNKVIFLSFKEYGGLKILKEYLQNLLNS